MTDCVGGVRHRKGKCDSCGGCKVCACECDGISVQQKLSRKRGGQPKHLRPPAFRKSRRMDAKRVNYDEHDDSDGDSGSNGKVLDPGPPTMTQVKRFFGISDGNGRNIPSRKALEELDMGDLDEEMASRLIHLMEMCVSKMCEFAYPKDPESLKLSVAERILKRPDAKTRGGVIEKLWSGQKNLPNRSLQQDALLAVLASSLSNAQLKQSFDIGSERAANLRRKYKFMCNGYEVMKPNRFYQRYDDNQVRSAVEYITENIQLLSWGTKKIKIDNNTIEIPRMLRTKKTRYMYRDYAKKCQDRGFPCVGQGTFEKICGTITANDTKARTAVDYASGPLFYDTTKILARLAQKVDCEDIRKECVLGLGVIDAFFKGFFDNHIEECAHQDYLKPPVPGVKRQRVCDQCQIPFKVLQYIKDNSDRKHSTVVDDCAEKLKLYMGHRRRVVNQRKRIAQVMQEMDEQTAYIVIDYKMKFNAMYYREKTVEHFGKRGMSWHGAMVYLKTTEEERRAALDEGREAEDFQVYYLDHISSNDTKQDRWAVLSIIESILDVVERDFGERIKKTIIQSDNAACYCNGHLIYGIHAVSKRTRVPVIMFIHTETQDGKGCIDAHFDKCMRHIRAFVDMDNDVITPWALVRALVSNGGVRNTLAILFNLDRAKLEKFIDANRSMLDYFDKIGRYNEVRYSNDTIELVDYSGNDPCKRIKLSTLAKELQNKLNKTRKRHVGGADERDDNNNMQGQPGGAEESSKDEKKIQGQQGFTSLDADDDLESDDDDSSESDNGFVLDLDEDDVDYDDSVEICEATGIRMMVPQRNPNTMARVMRTKRGDNDRQNYITIEDLRDCSTGDRSRCVTCGKPLDPKLPHVCELVFGRRDAEIFAIKILLAYLDNGVLGIIQLNKGTSNEIPVLPDVIAALEPNVPFETGSARRPKKGQMYGANYVSEYKEDIQRMFDNGAQDSRKRMDAARMLRALQKKYPDTLALPSEAQIKQAISQMKAKDKAQTNRNTSASFKSRYRPSPQHAAFFNEIISSRKKCDAEAFYDFCTKFEIDRNSGFPSRKQFQYQLDKLRRNMTEET